MPIFQGFEGAEDRLQFP